MLGSVRLVVSERQLADTPYLEVPLVSVCADHLWQSTRRQLYVVYVAGAAPSTPPTNPHLERGYDKTVRPRV